MNAIQDTTRGDIWLFDTANGGDIKNDGGDPIMTYGPENEAYLCLFGSVGEIEDFWGNDLLDPEQQLQGKFTQFMEQNPLNTNTVRQGEELAAQDLGSFISSGFCSDIEIAISIDGPKRISLRCVMLQASEVVADFEFTDNWRYIEQNNPGDR